MSSPFNTKDFIRITNEDPTSVERGKKFIRGRYAGEDYVFPFGVAVDIPIVAARHIFGFEQDNKAAALARLGWARSSSDLEQAMERLKLVRFDEMPQFVEVPRAKRTSAPTEHARPLVKVSGKSAAAAPAVVAEDPPALGPDDSDDESPDTAQAI